jgi:hypothetical protein
MHWYLNLKVWQLTGWKGQYDMSLLDSLLNGVQMSETIITLTCQGVSIVLPIPPEQFELSVSQNNQTVNINNAGDLAMIGKTGLKQLSLESFFPGQNYNFCVVPPGEPYSYIRSIDSWRTSGYPCHINILGTPIDFDCLINNFSYREQDASHDVYFRLDLIESRDLAAESLVNAAVNSITGLKERPKSFLEKVVSNATYHPGDSLMDVASRAVSTVTSVDGTNLTYLKLYQKLARRGKLTIGDVVTVTSKFIKVNDKNV